MKPIGKHKHLWYCLECGVLLQKGGMHVVKWFYVCDASCREKWYLRSENERGNIVRTHVKSNSNG